MATTVALINPQSQAFQEQPETSAGAAQNWHDSLSIQGCQLECAQRAELQRLGHNIRYGSGLSRSQKSKFIRHSHNTSLQKWFTLGELAASANSGCGSCSALLGIIDHVSAGDGRWATSCTEERVYMVSPKFLCSVRASSESEVISHVQLFQPPDLAAFFEYMPRVLALSGNTGSDIALGRLQTWLRSCTSSHRTCAGNRDGPLPSRLIDITELRRNDSSCVRLIQTTPGQQGTYVCLSHCWGITPITCCTKVSNLEKQLDFIELSSLPKNFRDAVAITRMMRIRYIWIDSLCIIQDSKPDWDAESARMAGIYRNAYFTIAATASADSTGGCFSVTSPDLRLSIHRSNGASYVVGARMVEPVDARDKGLVATRFPLLQRGWVFQERLLSGRVVYCNHGELAFECREQWTCECGNEAIPPHLSAIHSGMATTVIKRAHRQLMAARAAGEARTEPDGGDATDANDDDGDDEGDGDGDASRAWRQMVAQYMLLRLTKRSDTLPAISGCARIVQARTGDAYLAGLWRRSLHRDLLWHNKSRMVLPRTAACWTAPSWSWASVPPAQEIVFFECQSGWAVEYSLRHAIRSVWCVRAGENDLGGVRSGGLEIGARLLPAFVRRFCVDMKNIRPGKRRKTTKYGLHDQVDRCCGPNEVARFPLLDLRSADTGLFLDAPPAELFDFEPIGTCGECALASVWLLRMAQVQKTAKGLAQGIFMVLATARNVTSAKQFERTGMILAEWTIEQHRTWSDEVWNAGALPKDVITII